MCVCILSEKYYKMDETINLLLILIDDERTLDERDSLIRQHNSTLT